MNIKKLNSVPLKAYLDMVEETEPPVLMHIWSCIAAASAAAARHVWFDMNIEHIYPNQFILLVGPPGCRKNTAINLSHSLLEETNIRYAPDDTGGQRQGLLTALINEQDTADKMMEQLDDFEMYGDKPLEINLDENEPLTVDSHVLHIKASEFGSFMGQNNMDLARFLVKMWDGDDYVYMLKTSTASVRKPLVSMIGGTTPTDISLIMPQEAMGQGFMSRIILVHASAKHQHVARPRKMPEQARRRFVEIFRWISQTANGPMEEEFAAQQRLDLLYHKKIDIRDTRFLHYLERRHTHVIKLATTLALLRRSMRIMESDIEDADYILSQTELGMPDALGQYGLSPESVARQKMLDFLQSSKTPVAKNILWTVMVRDMKLSDFNTAINTFVNSGQIIETKVPGLGICYSLKSQFDDHSVRELLALDN